MLAFIDQIVIPNLKAIYDAVGYVGLFVAMTIESMLLPIPSEIILPMAGWMVSDQTKIEPLTHGRWDFWIVVIVGIAGNTFGSLLGYALGAWLGRPFLDRWGRFLLIRPHELEAADRFFAKWGPATAFISRLLPGIRSIISFVLGVSRMPLWKFVVYSALGAIPWTIALVYGGVVLGDNWLKIRETLQPFDTLIAIAVVLAVLLFIWWRLGMPGYRRRPRPA